MSDTEISTKVANFMSQSFDGAQFALDQDIFETGFGNSMFAMQLVEFVESEFAIEIDGDDLNIDNFRSVARITDLVARKREVGVA